MDLLREFHLCAGHIQTALLDRATVAREEYAFYSALSDYFGGIV
jgi:hypothetical protein